MSYALRVMKRREMNSLARSLCAYLSSRNDDIAGYWGIGMLCAASKREGKPKFSFKISPGQLIRIYGCEITGIAIAVTQGGRTGLSLSHIECWPHDPSRERRRAGAEAAEASWVARLKKILDFGRA